MTKIAFVADVHVGNHKVFGGPEVLGMNQRCWLTVNTVEEASTMAQAQGCEGFIIAGDLFDSIMPSPQMLAQTRDRLVSHMDVSLLLGNHDARSSEMGDNALAPLHDSNCIQVVDFKKSSARWKRPDGAHIYYVPFRPGKADDWFVKDVLDLYTGGEDNITVVTHLGMRDGTEAKWLANSHDSLDFKRAIDKLEKSDIYLKNLVAGNWHNHKHWSYKGTNIVQIGALAPTGFDNPGPDGYGVLAVLDLSTNKWHFDEVPGPRFIKWNGKAKDKNVQTAKRLRAVGNSVYLRWTVPQEYHAEASQIAHSLGVTYEMSIDGAEKKAAARSAGMSAKSATTLDKALAGFVNNMHLEEGIDRNNVLQHCRDYLAKHR